MSTTASKVEPVTPRKRDKVKGRPRTMREKFAARLRELAGEDRSAVELAEKWGVSADMARKYLKGTRMPPIDIWEAIADSFDLKHVRELLP